MAGPVPKRRHRHSIHLFVSRGMIAARHRSCCGNVLMLLLFCFCILAYRLQPALGQQILEYGARYAVEVAETKGVKDYSTFYICATPNSPSSKVVIQRGSGPATGSYKQTILSAREIMQISKVIMLCVELVTCNACKSRFGDKSPLHFPLNPSHHVIEAPHAGRDVKPAGQAVITARKSSFPVLVSPLLTIDRLFSARSSMRQVPTAQFHHAAPARYPS